MSRPLPIWNQSQAQLVVVSLGGNDFNHQHNHVPSNQSFSSAYEALLLQILTTMSKPPIVLSICGQGSPNEVRTDPDNNRCRPCSHVERASVEFNSKYSGRFDTNYIFVPCNGSIVTGVDDIG